MERGEHAVVSFDDRVLAHSSQTEFLTQHDQPDVFVSKKFFTILGQTVFVFTCKRYLKGKKKVGKQK